MSRRLPENARSITIFSFLAILLALRRALGVGHLQILRCGGVVSRLNGMEKSVYGTVGSVTA